MPYLIYIFIRSSDYFIFCITVFNGFYFSREKGLFLREVTLRRLEQPPPLPLQKNMWQALFGYEW